MAKTREIKRKARPLAAKKVRSAEEKRVKGGSRSDGGGATVGRAAFNEFSATKLSDKSSP
jgi:hypothetical protein